jgi:uncharacterized protein
MFREMRRNEQQLSKEATEEILTRGMSGVLAVSGDEGYPYAVPLSYAYESGKIYFHAAGSGHKVDGIQRNDKVSFCVIDQDRVVPEDLTTAYRSAIAFGRARIVEEQAVKCHGLELLAKKYSADYPRKGAEAIENKWQVTTVVEIAVEHLSGKQAKRLQKSKA